MTAPLIYAEIDLGAVDGNIRQLKQLTEPGTRLLAAVKANAYGHGAEAVARQALKSGADYLGVARLEEGLALRNAGIMAPILVLGYIQEDHIVELINHDLAACVYSPAGARAFASVGQQQQNTVRIHIKVDTGMGRLGMLCDSFRCTPAQKNGNTAGDVLSFAGLGGIEIEGIFSHFACADHPDKTSALCQLSLFQDLLDQLHKSGLEVPIRHMANSAAAIDIPAAHLDMIRPGIAVYGLNPSNGETQAGIPLKPAMAIKASIVHLKQVDTGFRVSYGGTFVTDKPTTIATVPVGYGDGYSRRLSSAGTMLVRGQRAPVVGRVCMDLTMIDVGQIAGVAAGDEVVILGTQGDETISAEEIAVAAGTINYEVVTAVSARVPRLFQPVSKRPYGEKE